MAADGHTNSLAGILEGDDGRFSCRERTLGILSVTEQSLEAAWILSGINASIFRLKLLGHMIGKSLVPIHAAEVNVACGRQHRAVLAIDVHERHIEGAAAQVVDENPFRSLGLALRRQETLLNTKCDGRRRGLIDDVQHFQSGEMASVLGGLAARFVEVGQDDHDAFLKWPQTSLGIAA